MDPVILGICLGLILPLLIAAIVIGCTLYHCWYKKRQHAIQKVSFPQLGPWFRLLFECSFEFDIVQMYVYFLLFWYLNWDSFRITHKYSIWAFLLLKLNKLYFKQVWYTYFSLKACIMIYKKKRKISRKSKHIEILFLITKMRYKRWKSD